MLRYINTRSIPFPIYLMPDYLRQNLSNILVTAFYHIWTPSVYRHIIIDIHLRYFRHNIISGAKQPVAKQLLFYLYYQKYQSHCQKNSPIFAFRSITFLLCIAVLIF